MASLAAKFATAFSGGGNARRRDPLAVKRAPVPVVAHVEAAPLQEIAPPYMAPEQVPAPVPAPLVHAPRSQAGEHDLAPSVVPEIRSRLPLDMTVTPAQRAVLQVLADGGTHEQASGAAKPAAKILRIALRRRGWVTGDPADLQITDAGRAALVAKEPAPADRKRLAYAARDALLAKRRRVANGEPEAIELDEHGEPLGDGEPIHERKPRRRANRTQPRKETVARKSLTKEDLQLGHAMYPPVDGRDEMRPKVRGDCEDGERPCPWVSCKYNLYLDVNPETGSITLNFPHLEPHELVHTCALDVADRGGVTLEETGAMMNLVRERIRQVEMRAKIKLAPVMRSDGWEEHETPARETPIGSIAE